jgi:hypothetical protein
MYRNDSLDDSSTSSYTPSTATNQHEIGRYTYSSIQSYLDGKLDEFRISDIPRTQAWSKATYYSNFDDFVRFGSEETP